MLGNAELNREALRALEQYVTDRPYAATSLLSVALARIFGTALAGTCAVLAGRYLYPD